MFLALPREHGLPEDQDEGVFNGHADFEQWLRTWEISRITHLQDYGMLKWCVYIEREGRVTLPALLLEDPVLC